MKGLIFTYVLTYGGGAASLVKPYYGLLIYVCFATVRPEHLWYWSVPQGGNFSRTAAIALMVGWALHGFGSWSFRGAKPVVYSLLAYFVWEHVSAASAAVPWIAWNQVELQGKIILPFIVGLTLIESLVQLRQLAWVLVLSMGYVALEANIAFLSGNNWLYRDGFGGMDNNSICIGMVAVAGLAFFLGISSEKVWQKLLALGAAGLMAHVPMFAFSRGGMLALIMTGFFSFVIIPKQPRHFVALAIAAVMALQLAGPEVRERFATVFVDAAERDHSSQTRLDMWAACWDLMNRKPLVGVGPDHWPIAGGEYGWGGRECHSIWFNAGAELGFPGLIFLLAFYGSAFFCLWRLKNRSLEEMDPEFIHIARMVIASIAGFVVAASFVSLDNLEPPYYVVLLGAGALKLASAADEQASETEIETEAAEELEPPVGTGCVTA